MTFHPRCPQCVFVSRQLGSRVPCLLHADAPLVIPTARAEMAPHPAPSDHDEPYVVGSTEPTTDAPGPFSLREYARLLVLRSKVREERRRPAAPSANHAGPSDPGQREAPAAVGLPKEAPPGCR